MAATGKTTILFLKKNVPLFMMEQLLKCLKPTTMAVRKHRVRIRHNCQAVRSRLSTPLHASPRLKDRDRCTLTHAGSQTIHDLS